MDLDLTDEQVMLRDTCRQFAREELLPRAGELDERAEFPREQVARMAELGLLGVMVPAEHGLRCGGAEDHGDAHR